MARDILKDSQCEAAKGKDKDYSLSDGGGLSLRVRPTGAKNWVFIYWMNGRQRRMGLGSYPDVSLKQARTDRDTARKLIAEERKDPIESRREGKKQERDLADLQRKIEAGEGPPRTVRHLFNMWRWGCCSQPTEPNAIPKGPLAKRKDGGAWVQTYFERDVFPVFGEKELGDVRQSDIWSVLDRMQMRNPEIRRLPNMVLSCLRQMFRFGIARGYTLVEPTLGITKVEFGGRERPRVRWLKEYELKELPKLLSASDLSKTSQIMIWLLLATGCRVGEMSKNTWKNINFENRDWFFPKEIRKGSHRQPAEDHHVFLTDFMIARLQELKQITGDSPFPFPHKRDRYAPIPDNSLRRQITTDAGSSIHTSGGHWTPHDLRRTCSTHLESAEFPQKVIDRCLGHYASGSAVQGAYFHWEYNDEARRAWESWSSKLEIIFSAPCN